MRHTSLEDRIEKLEKQVREQEKDIHELNTIATGLSIEVADLDSRIGRLEAFVGINEVISFEIKQTGDDMAIQGIAPGSTGTFTATPLDGNGNPVPLPAGAQPPQWASSDTTNAPVVASADGLSATVSVPSTTAGGSFTLSASSPDLPGSPSGSATVPINVPPPPTQTVASFQINQQS